MIRYALKCANDHGFESWFASAEAYDSLLSTGRVSCPECGISKVGKTLMAPSVRPGRAAAAEAPAPADAASRPLSVTSHPMEAALKALRKHLAENSEYVGPRFASEARAIHGGEAPERVIHGEARLDEVRELMEEGLPVTPLPIAPGRKTN
ncbi:hypothetical protein U879_18415 [Defluviimonas sp. 20V17]|uniref:DUF1178 family protein n=1 Tax=Allgaiera indica TaxID=765699 RepID=A0AAN5A056_9RHOB|nr:DUF1178 family protein [Allgaiera indica]KDB02244.1 hypothetical protein U879_18415 [Defluviimonas sp. 20V17]GHE02661.1 hypothetical protein GCM10008024_23090 [Allgaiera indica]SDX19573.1 hypothetical protein SAMN05444006_111117 [Allgaiera indica]